MKSLSEQARMARLTAATSLLPEGIGDAARYADQNLFGFPGISQGKAAAIIACGVILQGETSHAQNLSRSVTDALQRIAVDHAVPIINVVLSFDNESQARERCLENKINRGTEAARAAVKIANVMSKLRKS